MKAASLPDLVTMASQTPPNAWNGGAKVVPLSVGIRADARVQLRSRLEWRNLVHVFMGR
jgi:hypothetical protein